MGLLSFSGIRFQDVHYLAAVERTGTGLGSPPMVSSVQAGPRVCRQFVVKYLLFRQEFPALGGRFEPALAQSQRRRGSVAGVTAPGFSRGMR